MFEDLTPYGMVRLPELNHIAAETLRAAISAPETERTWSLLEALASEDVLDVLDQMPWSYMTELLDRWGENSGITVGELFGLMTNIVEHGAALEADLIDKGLRLRHCPSENFDWHDLKIIVAHSSVHSHLYAAVYPDSAGWDRKADLLALAADRLGILVWQPTENGRKGRNVPKQIPRPGVAVERVREGSKPKPSTLSEIKARFKARYATGQRPATSKPDRTQLKDLWR